MTARSLMTPIPMEMRRISMQIEPSGNIGHGNSSQLEQMRRGRRTSTGDANQMSVTAADGGGLGQEREADRTAVGGEQEGELGGGDAFNSGNTT